MSHPPPLLPHTVRIKRKRQDEPVDTLHVHTQEGSKRPRRTDDHDDQQENPAQAIFRRVRDVQETASETRASPPSASRQQSLFSSSSGAPPPDLPGAAAASPGLTAAGTSRTLAITGTGSRSRRILPTLQATRRFHLARASLGSSSASSATTATGSEKKRKNVATLVESKPKKLRASDEISAAVTEWVTRRAQERNGQQPSSLKRPGKSSAVSTPRKPLAASASPVSQVQPQHRQQTNAHTTAASNGSANAVDPDLLADMQRFAREVESAEQQPASASNFNSSQQQQQQQQHPGTPTSSSSTPQKLKFQPRPTPRYCARNPRPAANAAGPSTAMDIDASATSSSSDSDDDGGGDYVYDTYILSTGPADTVLHNATSSAATAATMSSIPAAPLPQSVGLLIIRADDEPLWEAYADDDGAGGGGDGDDDDDAFDTDDEDSNAEDWRGNEYPEEEEEEDDDDAVMGEDTDGGRAASRVQQGLGRIEDEEWDARGADGGVDSDGGVGDGWGDSADDAVWSDEDEERMRRPFAVPGWLKR